MNQSLVRCTAKLLRVSLCLLLLAVTASNAVGQESSPTPNVGDANRVAPAQPQRIGAVKKERVVTAAVFLLVLVVIVVAGLLLVVVLWGRRIRRVVRAPTARIVPGDELWYLKPKKYDATTQSTTMSEEDEQQERENDLPPSD